jgi:hypothetical protein
MILTIHPIGHYCPLSLVNLQENISIAGALSLVKEDFYKIFILNAVEFDDLN